MALRRPIGLAAVAVGSASGRRRRARVLSVVVGRRSGKLGAPVSGGPPGGRVGCPCPSPPCRTGAGADAALPAGPLPGPPCRWVTWQACRATRLGSGVIGPKGSPSVRPVPSRRTAARPSRWTRWGVRVHSGEVKRRADGAAGRIGSIGWPGQDLRPCNELAGTVDPCCNAVHGIQRGRRGPMLACPRCGNDAEYLSDRVPIR